MSSEIASNNPVVAAVITGSAPRPAQLAASRGLLPLPQNDLLEILVHFASENDQELKENARATLRDLDLDAIETMSKATDVAPAVLAYYATIENLPQSIYESIVTNARTPPDAVARLARSTSSGQLLELISLNQQLLIRHAVIIDAIQSIDPRFPEVDPKVRAEFTRLKAGLEAERRPKVRKK